MEYAPTYIVLAIIMHVTIFTCPSVVAFGPSMRRCGPLSGLPQGRQCDYRKGEGRRDTILVYAPRHHTPLEEAGLVFASS